jgi:hypothetical protein
MAKPPKTQPRSKTAAPGGAAPAGEISGRRNRVTISLSDKSVEAFRELRKQTDADSDSEVFRNALRLYLGLLRAHQSGKKLCLRNPDGSLEPVELFFPVS